MILAVIPEVKEVWESQPGQLRLTHGRKRKKKKTFHYEFFIIRYPDLFAEAFCRLYIASERMILMVTNKNHDKHPT